MARNSLQPRWRVALALLMVVLCAATLAPVFAQGEPPAEPLVPNVEPATLAADPAPWAAGERAAVEAALAALAERGDLTPPEGAFLELTDVTALSDAQLAATYRIYLPLLRRRAELGQQPPTPTPVTPTPVTPTPVTPTPQPGEGADVAVTIWPKPSIWVARGALLEYEIRLHNTGKGAARETKVVFPYNRSQVTLVSSSLDSRAGDWVSAIDQQSFTVTFGNLAEGARRTGKVVVRVASGLAHQTLLDVRASYTWRDGVDGGGQRANWTPVLVGSGPSDAPYIWVQVSPDRGAAGTRHRFYTNRLLPGEAVSTWLNTPQGVRPLTLRGTADADGAVTLDYRSSGLARGTYQLVLYGQRSGLTGVATFIVQ
ncbi:MAG: hypothetical protein OHK0015_06160 [Chloroflexi bacterium OHK40]